MNSFRFSAVVLFAATVACGVWLTMAICAELDRPGEAVSPPPKCAISIVSGNRTTMSVIWGCHDRTHHVYWDWVPACGLARYQLHTFGACTRCASHHAAVGSPEPALDDGTPGRQGSVARRIRHVDPTARNERGADEGEDYKPARGDRQEERSHRLPQARARRKVRGALCARSQGKTAGRRPPEHSSRSCGQSQRVGADGTRAYEHAGNWRRSAPTLLGHGRR